MSSVQVHTSISLCWCWHGFSCVINGFSQDNVFGPLSTWSVSGLSLTSVIDNQKSNRFQCSTTFISISTIYTCTNTPNCIIGTNSSTPSTVCQSNSTYYATPQRPAALRLRSPLDGIDLTTLTNSNISASTTGTNSTHSTNPTSTITGRSNRLDHHKSVQQTYIGTYTFTQAGSSALGGLGWFGSLLVCF